MAREKEMQEFTRSFFRGRPDLSKLTHSIVRRRFLAHAGRDHLEPEERQALKRLVEEELLKMQVDEEGAKKEGLRRAKKAKRAPTTPCSDPQRKRSRFNSESEPSSAASSPDCFGPPAKNGMAAAGIPAKESAKRASKKAVESNEEEEQQRDLTAKTGLEKEAVRKRGEEEEGSASTGKVWKEESSEDEDEGKESKGRTQRKSVTKDEQAPGTASRSRRPSTEESESSEGEPAQSTGSKGAESHQESEEDSEEESEEEKTLAKKKENREEAAAGEQRSAKQRSRTARLQGHCGDREGEEEKAAAGSGDDGEGDDQPSGQRKSKDRTKWERDKKQSGSSEDEEDRGKRLTPAAEGTGKTASGEASDSERELSDSEAGGSPQGDRKSHSSRKSSKRSRTRSSSSADSSPELRGRKARGTGRQSEDHPAVMRLKRYIRACGAYRNYKKLLGSCCSRKECLRVLRAELEALGMKGNPSLEKCRALKVQREEAAEVAALDVSNIISGSGRPRRCTAWNPSEAVTPGELYRRTLDSDEERPRRPPPDWSHMRGIISSDGESN